MTSYLLRMMRRDERRNMTGRATLTRGTYPQVVTVYENLPCLVRPSKQATTEVKSGGEQLSLALYDVKVPYGTDIRRGDVLTITASDDTLQVGEWVTVVEVVVDEWGASRVAVAQRSRS